MQNASHSSALAPLILVVEDDLSTRVMYREFLTHSGFRIMDAHNGHQALAKAHEASPDAVLTDLAVPGMDGFELCRALQQLAGTRSIPILAVTGHAEYLDQHARFRHAGISHVLPKPCPPDTIAHELRRLLRDASTGDNRQAVHSGACNVRLKPDTTYDLLRNAPRTRRGVMTHPQT